MSTPAIELRNIGKSFAAVHANAGVNLTVMPGTIHGIIGENGAGKSTAMKILYGLYKPDEGEIMLHGKARRWASPRDAIAAGIGMVHQHFMLGRPYTALDNIILGAEPVSAGVRWLPKILQPVNRAAARAKLEKLSQETGLFVDWDAPVESLPVGVQQRIEILKLLYRDANVLILDEPTAVLTPQEVVELFGTLRKLKEQGKTIIIITHKLREVMSLTDAVTVFRAGRVTGERQTRETHQEELAELMVGRKVVLRVDDVGESRVGAPVLQLEKVCLAGLRRGDRARLSDLDLVVREGEIVGIAGVEGNGQSELLQVVCHPEQHFKSGKATGHLKIFSKDVRTADGGKVKSLGVGVIPEDRQREALLMDSPLDENFLLGFQRDKRFSRFGFLKWGTLRSLASRACEEYDVRPRVLWNKARGLSGGNQQKLVIGREFERSPRFLVAAHPTRGVDVGAIEFIHKRILKARESGVGVLLVSSELDEVLSLSDRILVMYEGKVIAQFSRGECDETTIGFYMGGGGARQAKPAIEHVEQSSDGRGDNA